MDTHQQKNLIYPPGHTQTQQRFLINQISFSLHSYILLIYSSLEENFIPQRLLFHSSGDMTELSQTSFIKYKVVWLNTPGKIKLSQMRRLWTFRIICYAMYWHVWPLVLLKCEIISLENVLLQFLSKTAGGVKVKMTQWLRHKASCYCTIYCCSYECEEKIWKQLYCIQNPSKQNDVIANGVSLNVVKER